MKNNGMHKLLKTIWENTSGVGNFGRGSLVKIEDVMISDPFKDSTIWYYPVEFYNGEYYELDEEHNTYSELVWFFKHFKRVRR